MAEVLPSVLPSDFDEAATQAAIKGGIGFFVAQGLAKRGHTCNPNHSCFSPTITRKSLQQQLRNTWTPCPPVDHAGEAVFHRPAFDFERHNKADVFRVSSRSTRCSDLDTCSKWAALSFFENDPKRIRHHLEILKSIENQAMLDSLIQRAQREQRLTAVQDRIRYDFGVRQLQNALKSTRSGQQSRKPGPSSSTYSLCRTEASPTSHHTKPARPHTSPATAVQPTPLPPSPRPLLDAEDRTLGPQTVLPSAAWGLQDSHQGRQVDFSGAPACTETRRQLGTPKVGLSTWTWGGASSTLAAVAGVPLPAAPVQAAAQPLPARPSTAQPFRIRSRMEREIQSGKLKQMQRRRASSAHPARRAHGDEADLLELDRFQQRLDYWKARQPGMAPPVQRPAEQAQES